MSGEISSSNRPKLDLVQLTPKNLGQVKVLNCVCFPVTYRESFYEQLLANTDNCRLGYLSDCLVGTVGCKVVDSKQLYIMTLGVLPRYRRFGFASQLLQWSIEHATDLKLEEVVLHVQTNNEEALSFYKKHGFVIKATEPEYYPQLVPSSAYYLTKQI